MNRASAARTHQPWYPSSWVPSRPRPALPDDTRLAVSVLLDLRAVEWETTSVEVAVRPPGGRGSAPAPDLPRMSHREFGHRVGVFRLLERLRDLEIRPAVVLDVLTAEHYPAVVDALQDTAGEVIAGGLSGSRAITSLMHPDEERDYIACTLDRLTVVLPDAPTGWFGPEHSESARTPVLLAEHGLTYVADWGSDEQPFALPGAPPLWAFPVSWELSDVAATFHRQVLPRTYARGVIDAIDRLHQDGSSQPRVLGLHLHPWLSGQPFRMAAVIQVLEHLRTLPHLRVTTPAEIVGWWRDADPRVDDGSRSG